METTVHDSSFKLRNVENGECHNQNLFLKLSCCRAKCNCTKKTTVNRQNLSPGNVTLNESRLFNLYKLGPVILYLLTNVISGKASQARPGWPELKLFKIWKWRQILFRVYLQARLIYIWKFSGAFIERKLIKCFLSKCKDCIFLENAISKQF